MDDWHSLLKRQLRRHFGDLDSVPEELHELLANVSAAYADHDDDRHLMERSLELSSKELVQANSEMRAVFRAFPDVFLRMASDGTILSVQQGRQTDVMLPTERLLGKKVTSIPDREVAAKLAGAVHRVRSGEQLVSIEYSMISGGRESRFEARLMPLRGGQILAVVRNITERAEALKELAREKEQLAITLRSIGDGVITTDTSGNVILINRAAEKLTGWQSGEANGKGITSVLNMFNEKTGVPLENPAMQILHSGAAWVSAQQGTLKERTAEDPDRLVLASAASIRDRHSRIVGVVVVFRDVTEERKLDEERFRASKLESIGILAGGIAHDFNNILQALLGNISLAQMQLAEDPKVSKLLSNAERASLRARDLTQQLLTFSKGGMPVKATASVEQLIQESSTFALRGSNVSCEFLFAPDLAPVEVDQGQMSQVINNLIINADQAMPDGGSVVIGAEFVLEPDVQGMPLRRDGYVRIYVKDSGEGIGADILPLIFDPYFTTKQRGSGLGLSTSYSIVKNHGGMITAESELGEGTTFSVYLPASSNDTPSKESKTAGVEGGQGRVLVMDDEENVRQIAGNMLTFLGYSVDFAADGREGISKYEAARGTGTPFDLVIVDLTVPGGMGGKEMVETLIALDPKLSAIASSGYSNDPVLASFGDFGFRGILTKPYNIRELDKTLQKVMASAD
jgi:PAS domain S-box-containing protein